MHLLKQSVDLNFCGRCVSIITQICGYRNQNRNTRTTEQNDWKSQKDKDYAINTINADKINIHGKEIEGC